MPAFHADAVGFSLFDGDETEAYALTDLLAQVRDLTHEAEDLPFSFASDEDVLVWALATLCDSPLARGFAFDARFEDWSVELDDCAGNRAIADLQLRTLILPRFVPSGPALGRTPYFRHQLLVEFCRGLRAIWHLDSNVRPGRDLTITDQVCWNRLLQLDYDLVALAIAWELREAGTMEVWRHLIGSDLGDFAVALSAILERHPQGISQLKVFQHLVPRFMEDQDYLNLADHQTLENLDQYLRSPGSGKPFGSRRLDVSDLLRLSALPDETMYLQPFAVALLSDPLRSRMTDLVNDAHLLQIMQDLTALNRTRSAFRDADLARRFFPDLPGEALIDTLA